MRRSCEAGAVYRYRWNDDIKDYELLVGWKGLQTIEDSYKPVMSLSKEIRVLVNNYVAEAGDQELSAYWKRAGGEGEPSVVSVTPAVEPSTTDASTRRRASGKKRRRRSTGASRKIQTGEDDVQAVTNRILPGNTPSRIRVSGENAQASEGMAFLSLFDAVVVLTARTRSEGW
ncbi:hypothetical protein DVH05_017832 [Phytophthora capsici]|nr:hypothetical protein DVH05_017832 [Phytophthora capsici]